MTFPGPAVDPAVELGWSGSATASYCLPVRLKPAPECSVRTLPVQKGCSWHLVCPHSNSQALTQEGLKVCSICTLLKHLHL